MKITSKENLTQSLELMKDKLSHVSSYSHEITDILEQLELLNIHTLGNSMTDGVFVCDKDGTILYVNETNQRLVGISAADCIGKNISTFEEHFHNLVISPVFETGLPYSSIIVPQNTGIHLLEIGSPVKNDSGDIIGCVVIDKDISETYRLAEELKDSRSKIASYESASAHNASVINYLNQQNIDDDIISTKSEAMNSVYLLAEQAAKTDVTTLLSGETGTGKEVIANYIFEKSKRNKKPYIKVNCAAIPEHLLESELFGYEKGAFTGANTKGKIGMFELANEGTLFLDEIGELPLEFQAKLLRAIQQQEIMRIGGTTLIKLNIRIIAATNRDLKEMVANGQFREDLFYRLNIFPIQIPPLRERKEDIRSFIAYFTKLYNKKYDKNIVISSSAIRGMESYQWPGNIRELENMIERWVVVYAPYTTVTWEMIEHHYDTTYLSSAQEKFQSRSLKELTADFEKEVLIWAAEKYETTRQIAEALDVDHSTVVRKANTYDIKIGKKRNTLNK